MMTDPASTFAASMLRDVEAGGASEGDHVLGDLARRGAAAGLRLPALSMAALNLAVYERRRSAGQQAGQR
jgi:2-dehydropantoate 2-reductase